MFFALAVAGTGFVVFTGACTGAVFMTDAFAALVAALSFTLSVFTFTLAIVGVLRWATIGFIGVAAKI